MNKRSHAFDFQQKPKPAAIARDAESNKERAALSDDDLEQVNAAGETSIPTLNPNVLLGKHNMPTGDEDRKP